MADEGIGSLLGILSGSDDEKLKQLLPIMSPMVSPWATLGAGALLGIYGQDQQVKDNERAIALNARMAELSPWTNMAPQQVSFQDPSLVGNVLGGMGAAQGVAGSINAHSPAYNVYKQLGERDQKKAEAAASAALLAQGMGPIREDFDPTLASGPVESPYFPTHNVPQLQTDVGHPRLPEDIDMYNYDDFVYGSDKDSYYEAKKEAKKKELLHGRYRMGDF